MGLGYRLRGLVGPLSAAHDTEILAVKADGESANQRGLFLSGADGTAIGLMPSASRNSRARSI
jgi:hypothetical protein